MSRALTFNTYGGNPLASAVGMAVLDAIEEDGCQQIADTVGTHLLKGFEEIRNEFEVQCLQFLFEQSPFYVLIDPNSQCYFTT